MRKVIGLMMMVCLLCTAGMALAQGSPEATVKSYMTALQKEDVKKFVSVMHPAALADFKKMMMPVVELAVAKKKEAQVMPLFKGVKDAAQLKKMAPADVFAAFYKGLLGVMPQLSQVLSGSKMEVLGHVKEGKDIAHVVYRATMTVGRVKVKKVDVTSCKLYKGKWMIMLSGDIEGLATQIKMQIQQSLNRPAPVPPTRRQ